MKIRFVAAALALAFAAPAFADDKPASPHTFTGNVALTTDYAFRGISQTNSQNEKRSQRNALQAHLTPPSAPETLTAHCMRSFA